MLKLLSDFWSAHVPFIKPPHLLRYRLWPSISPHCKLDSSNCLNSFPLEMNCAAADTLVWVSLCVFLALLSTSMCNTRFYLSQVALSFITLVQAPSTQAT